ncbi:MAG: hypothetical protein V4515_04285 [Chloroflexota bacterium]
MNTRLSLVLLPALIVLTAGCSSGSGASPSPSTPTAAPTPAPTSSPAAAKVRTPDDAAALIGASDQRFLGIGKQNPDVIGASAWWTSDPIADGGFRMTYVVGWGDCQAGCISRHQWIFEVTADGKVTLVDESGDPLQDG